jgi:hypothetical protein
VVMFMLVVAIMNVVMRVNIGSCHVLEIF